MKKIIMMISIVCLSLCLSDLSFAKKKRRGQKSSGPVRTTLHRTGSVVHEAGEGAGNIVKATGNAGSRILDAF